MKAAASWLVLIVLIGGVVALASGGNDDGDGASRTASEDGKATIEIVGEESVCEHDTVSRTVDFVIALRNTGDAADEVSVIPIRYYSDGEKNDSIIDAMTGLGVPADGALHRFHATYKVDPVHLVTACGARISGETDEVPIPVQ